MGRRNKAQRSTHRSAAEPLRGRRDVCLLVGSVLHELDRAVESGESLESFSARLPDLILRGEIPPPVSGEPTGAARADVRAAATVTRKNRTCC